MPENFDSDALLYLPPRLSREEAAQALVLRSPLPPFRKLRMDRVELVFLPHYLFRTRVEWEGVEEVQEAAVDAVLGYSARFSAGPSLSPAPADVSFELPFLLSRTEAQAKLEPESRWALIAAALKLRRSFLVKAIEPGPRLYYPFWVGYYRAGRRWRFEVLDAIAAMRQGGKVRDALIAAWLCLEREREATGK